MVLPQYVAAQDLENFLGDPENPSVPFNFSRSVQADEAAEAPATACELLDDWGMNLYYIPQSAGGKLQTFEQALALGRVISRRDLSAAIEHSISFLGYAFVWLAGSAELQERAAGVIRKRGRIALGLTEKEHGGDLSACECMAEFRDGRYVLTGEKWLINNATRGQAISLFARTEQRGGPRGFSFLFVDKSRLAERSCETLAKVLTHGIRGVDISGIRFTQAVIDPADMIGAPGTGLETALKGLQVTRTMCSNLSLGATDTALRIALDFASNRRIYSSTVIDIPAARGTLTEAFVDLLMSDCVSIAGARALHVLPSQMSVHSAIVKYFVPVTCERILQSLSVVLGARHYLREGHWHGMFQKILRDIGIVSLFDGSTAVNLNVISAQLLSLCDHEPRNTSEIESDLKQLFDLSIPVPPFDRARLALMNKGAHHIVQVIPEIHRWLARAPRDEGPADIFDELDRQLDDLKTQYALFRHTISSNAAAARHSHGQTSEMFEMARRYCLFHAAACCLLMWTENRNAQGGFFARGEWLTLALERALRQICSSWKITPLRHADAVSSELIRMFYDRTMFSVVPLALAGRRQPVSNNSLNRE